MRSIIAPPTNDPIGMSPTEIVRAVLPIRPSIASGESAVRNVMYPIRTTDCVMPATRAPPTSTATGAPIVNAKRMKPVTTVPTSRARPTASGGRRPAASDPISDPTPNAERMMPSTSAGRPRSRVT